MRDLGPAVELIWWDDESQLYRWTYWRNGVHRGGEAWTWKQAEDQLSWVRHRTITPSLPVVRPAGAVDRTRYRLGRGPT